MRKVILISLWVCFLLEISVLVLVWFIRTLCFCWFSLAKTLFYLTLIKFGSNVLLHLIIDWYLPLILSFETHSVIFCYLISMFHFCFLQDYYSWIFFWLYLFLKNKLKLVFSFFHAIKKFLVCVLIKDDSELSHSGLLLQFFQLYLATFNCYWLLTCLAYLLPACIVFVYWSLDFYIAWVWLVFCLSI